VQNHEILEYTQAVAAELAASHTGDPLGELRIWVRLAHQREAMVTQLYELSQLDARLPGTDGPAASFVRSAVESIWAHEESHTRFLASVRSFGEEAPALAELRGKLEGKVTRSAVSGHGALARWMIAVGAALGQTPGFAADLREMTLRELLAFYGELEATARHGYERIRQLLAQLEKQAAPEIERLFGYTFPFDIARILCEEAFHEDAFDAIGKWVAPAGNGFVDMPADECARVLHDICERNLSTGAAARRLLGEAADKGDVAGDWISDGGLGALFARHQLAVPLWRAPQGGPPLPFAL
jgi:hypothetical protein